MQLSFRKYNVYAHCLETDFTVAGNPKEILDFLDALGDSEIVKREVRRMLDKAKLTLDREISAIGGEDRSKKEI